MISEHSLHFGVEIVDSPFSFGLPLLVGVELREFAVSDLEEESEVSLDEDVHEELVLDDQVLLSLLESQKRSFYSFFALHEFEHVDVEVRGASLDCSVFGLGWFILPLVCLLLGLPLDLVEK